MRPLTLSLNFLLSFYFTRFSSHLPYPLPCSSPSYLIPHPSPPLLLTSPLSSSPSYLTPHPSPPLLLILLLITPVLLSPSYPTPLLLIFPAPLLQVSLLKLAEITEQGVTFKSPIDGSEMLLTPEQSIQCQNEIGKHVNV